jgi:hypothetical protein
MSRLDAGQPKLSQGMPLQGSQAPRFLDELGVVTFPAVIVNDSPVARVLAHQLRESAWAQAKHRTRKSGSLAGELMTIFQIGEKCHLAKSITY